MSQGSDRALGEFLSEAQELVETLNRNLLTLDEQRSQGLATTPEILNDCFRAVHSLKGLTALFGLTETAELAHRLENLLDAIRLGKVEIRPNSLDLLFEAVELFNEGLSAATEESDLEAAQVSDYLRRLDAVTSEKAPVPGSEGAEGFGGYQIEAHVLSVLTEYEEHRLRDNIRQGAAVYRISGQFDLMEIDKGIEEIKSRLKPVAEIITYLPAGEGGDTGSLRLEILCASKAGDSALLAALAGSGVELARIRRDEEPEGEEVEAREPAAQPTASPKPAQKLAGDSAAGEANHQAEGEDQEPTLRSIGQSVRVDIRKLDGLMNAVGEMSLVHTGLSQLLVRMSETQFVGETQTLRRELRALERKLHELQTGILEVRMVPLRQVFDKLARVVRKVSRQIGKQIRLEISGAETELDKIIVEELSDPLMHIIRNAIDHGLESEEERIAAGKPAVGTISVAAVQQGNRVLVSVADDGKGIDELAIGRAAVKRGLVDAAAVAEMNKTELLNLLFLPGMSTKEEVTELSGRGVGMDVVKSNISNLSGIIDVTSMRGQGTKVTITLPITLAIIQTVVVRVAGRTYALPLNSVIESLVVEPADIKTIEGRQVISLRDQTVRLVRIEDIFQLSPLPLSVAEDCAAHEFGQSRSIHVVVVGVAWHRLGLIVDEFVGQQDIVIKPLGRALSGVRGIAGATELGGQKTVLVLDVPGMVETALNRLSGGEAWQ